MGTIAEIESELEAVTKETQAAWAVYKEEQRKIEPLNLAWYALHQRQQRLEQVLQWRKEMEAAT